MPASASLLEPYIARASVIHRLDARIKIVLTLAFIVSTTATPPGAWPMYGLYAILVWSTVLLSRVGPFTAFRRSMLALPFMLIALPTIFTKEGAPLFHLGVFAWEVTGTQEGLTFVLSVLLKSWISVSAAGLLAATTPFREMLQALRFLKTPVILVSVISFMYRYIFVLVDEAHRLLRAREARSAAISSRSGGSLSWRAHVVGGMAGSLFLRTYERSERIYQAMLARGFDGETRGLEPKPLARAEVAIMTAMVAFSVALTTVANLVW